MNTQMLRLIALFCVLSVVSGGSSSSTLLRALLPKILEELDVTSESDEYLSDVLFYLYTRENKADPTQVFLNNITSINESNFSSSRPTKILVHGWLDDLSKDMIQLNKNEFLANYDVNVVAVDWSAFAGDLLYFTCVKKVPIVGNYIGQFINFLITKVSVNASDVHIIGHSLGAHVSGFAGKALQKDGYNISRISGLDPAWPGYYTADNNSRLAASDAQYVDVIHTCAYIAGFPKDIGQADFYPNGGVHPQPGCSILDLACSHKRAYKFYALSINETNDFSAQPCEYVSLGKAHDCSEGESLARMGYPANKEQDLGTFYLQTSESSPYALG